MKPRARGSGVGYRVSGFHGLSETENREAGFEIKKNGAISCATLEREKFIFMLLIQPSPEAACFVDSNPSPRDNPVRCIHKVL